MKRVSWRKKMVMSKVIKYLFSLCIVFKIEKGEKSPLNPAQRQKNICERWNAVVHSKILMRNTYTEKTRQL